MLFKVSFCFQYLYLIYFLSDSQDAIVLHLLQVLIGRGPVGGKRKRNQNTEENHVYQPVEIRECFINRVEVS